MSAVWEKAAFFLKLLRLRATGARAPLFVFFNVTNRCNARCSYCFGAYYERYASERRRELTTGQILSVIDGLSDMGTRRIGITGGEPLLREDIAEIIARIRERGMSCGLNTNGFLVPARLDDIRGVDNVTISLDGDRDAHDANRGKGSFDRVMAAVEAVRAAAIPLHLSTVVTARNRDSLDFVMEFARQRGVPVQVSPLYERFWGEKDEGFPAKLDQGELRETIGRVMEYKRRGYPVFFSLRTYEKILAWPYGDRDRVVGEEPDFPHARCYMGRLLCTIDASGDVYPCAQLEGFRVKNAVEDGLRDAFDNIADHDCRACLWACYNEYNLLFALDPAVLWNTVRNALTH